MKRFCILALMLMAIPAVAEKEPFTPYQGIVDRQMFGPLPDDFDPTKSPSEVTRSASAGQKELTKEQEKLQSAIHFSMINVKADGVVEVGFSDKSDPKSVRSYCLNLGETRDGWTVLDADPQTSSMTIVNAQGIEVTLTLGGDSSKGNGSTSKATNGNDGQSLPRRSGLLNATASTLRSRRQAREAERQKQQEQEEKRRAEEKEQRLQEAEDRRQELEALRESIKSLREVKLQNSADASADKANQQGEDENHATE